MFTGVNHVGISVSDMNRSIDFYGDVLGFTETLFDFTGNLPGLDKATGKKEINARIVMLQHQNKGPVGLGMVKLIHLLPPYVATSIPENEIWGETGLAEIALNTRNTAAMFGETIRKGAKPLLPPSIPEVFPPYENNVVSVSYIADPDGCKIELNELCETWPGLGKEPRIEGINHVAFGASDVEKTLEFYKQLGFTELVVDYAGYVDCMATWYPKPTKLRIVIMANYHGAWIEVVGHFPPSKNIKNNWGRLGPVEFAIGVNNLERAYSELTEKGHKFLCPPQSIDVDTGQWKYAYITAPDNLCVCLSESRY